MLRTKNEEKDKEKYTFAPDTKKKPNEKKKPVKWDFEKFQKEQQDHLAKIQVKNKQTQQKEEEKMNMIKLIMKCQH